MVSIIIPTYNRAALLQEAVQSCLEQAYSDIEIIIVDDGSTDDTEVVVQQALRTTWANCNIKYIKQLNAGASAARNLGMEMATGDFIQFLDSDDLLFPDKLSLQVEWMLTTGAEGCASYGIMGTTPEDAQEILGEDFSSVKDLMHRMCSGRVHVMCTPAPLWKRSILQNNGRWSTDIAFGDDLDFHIRVLSSVEKMAFVPEKLFFVREHTVNRLSDAENNQKQIESGIKTQQRVTETLKESRLWKMVAGYRYCI